MALLQTIGSHSPAIDPGARLAPNAVVAGAVTLGPDVSVWYHAVLRSEEDRIEVGARTNIQDAVVIHTDEGSPALIGHDVQIGHAAVMHGCVVEPGVLIGMSATVLNGSRIRWLETGCAAYVRRAAAHGFEAR